MSKSENLNKTVCFNCGTEIVYNNDDDCWSTAFHVPFDSMQKIKKIMKNNCLCSDCLKELIKKNK